MKKTIKKPDGTEEVVEGTAAEIAEYERKLRGEVKESPVKGPKLLTEEGEKKLNQVLDSNFLKELDKFFSRTKQHSTSCQLVTAQGGWMSIFPPQCTCGVGSYVVSSPDTMSSTHLHVDWSLE